VAAPLNTRTERQLAQAFAVLGLQPGASSQDVEAAYFTQRSTLAGQENTEQRLQQLERAIRFIKVRTRFGDRKQTSAPDPARDADRLDRALRLLGLSAGASKAQVDAAMKAVMKTVTDDERRREFQKAAYVVNTRGRVKRSRRRVRHVSRFLIVASLTLVVLTVFSGFQLSGRFRHHIVSFDAGDPVYRLDDRTPFGVIVSFEAQHRFPNGALRDAYNVRLYPDDKEAWISARTAQTALTTSP